MKTSIALCMLLGSGATAFAQDEFFMPLKMSLDPQAGVQLARPGDVEWSTEVFFRYSLIGGNDGTGSKWNDDFSDGIGFRVEGTWEYHLNEHWSIGGYLSTGLDIFPGNTQGGVTLDDWLVIPVTIGFKGKAYFGKGFFAEAYIGIGFVFYNGVDGTSAVAVTPVIDSSLAFAFELGAHLGYRFTQNVGILFGVGYAGWGAPALNQSTFPGGMAQPVENVTIDFGIWIRY
jgi:hypothetical protein